MVNLLERLRNRLLFNEGEGGGAAAGAVTDPPASDPPKVDDPPPTEDVKEYVVDGEIVRLTPTQRERAIHLGIVKAKEQMAAEKKRLADEQAAKDNKIDAATDKKPDETLKQYEKRIADLEHAHAVAADQAVLARVDMLVEKGDVLEDFKDDVTKLILTEFALRRQNNKNLEIGEVAKSVIDAHKKKTEKFRATIDVDKKLKDAEKTRTQGSGRTSPSQDDLPKLGRNAFRDGSLRKRVAERAKKILGE